MCSPLVSIVIRTHNRAPLLRIALKSLINQTYRPIEIFVVDHNSNDDTRSVVTSFGSQVIYYRHTGCYRDTFNVWRDKINGKFVSVLDDDDFLKPNCIENLVKVLKENCNIDIVFARHIFFRSDHGDYIFDKISPQINVNKIRNLLMTGNVIPWNAVLFRRHCLDGITKIGSSISGAFDWFFWIQMAIAGYKFSQINDILGFIRRSPDSVQYNTKMMGKGVIDCIVYYGRHISLLNRLFIGYYYILGYRLICYGIICLENGNPRIGRRYILKGLFKYLFAIRNRIKLIPAIIIFYASLISNYKKSRLRIENIFKVNLFRNYHQKDDMKSILKTVSFWNIMKT